MEILVDLRCLQDENYAYRGVGFHTATLLLLGRRFLSPDTKLVGLIDPSMPDVSNDHHSLMDEFRNYYAAARFGEMSCFIQTSPMTHDPLRCGALVANRNVYSAAIVYDFIPLDFPKRYLPSQSAANCYAEQLAWLSGYDQYFPISQSTAKLLMEILNVDRRDVHVTGVALRNSFERIAGSLANSTSIVEPNERKLTTWCVDRLRPDVDLGRGQNHALKSAISGEAPYIVSVGGDDPRKNLDVLLAAHARLAHRSSVIVIGKYTDSSIDRMYDLYGQYGGRKSQLQFLKGITDDQLAELYRNAEFSVCCSEIEGFSLPVLEAIACGCPTILSDNLAHRELVSAEDAFFPPGNIDALVHRLDLFLNDASRREKLLRSQSEMPKRFLATEVAKRFWYPITKALQTRQGVQRRSVHYSLRLRNRIQKPRLAVVSPFPPDASGVADYTRKSIESIGRLVDVDVFTDSLNPVPSKGVKHFYPISNLAYLGDYDRVLSVIGNSHFHIKMIEMQRIYGGACLVHDNRLAELYNWWKGPEYLANMASKSLERPVSTTEVKHWVDNPGLLPSVFFDELIPAAQPLIVHSKGIQSQCIKEYGIDVKYLPFCVYRDFDLERLSDVGKNESRHRLNMTPDQIVIVSFGIVNKTKAPDTCIEALYHLHKSDIQAHLYFVGSAGNQQAWLEDQAKKFGIQHFVHLRQKWFSETEYLDYLHAADFAIQLRTHFFGGLSGAMLDCIGSGLPTVANDDLAVALDSPEYVLNVRDQLSAELIAQRIEKGYRSGVHIDRLKPSREKYVTEHSFESYAKQLVEILGMEVNTDEPTPYEVERVSRFSEITI